MMPYGWGAPGAPSQPTPPDLTEAKTDIEFLLSLVPGWALNPIVGLNLPGHTLEYEQRTAARVRAIRERWFPPPPPETDEEVTE